MAKRTNPKSKTLSCICDEVKNDIYGHDGSFFKNTKNGMSRCKCAFTINSSGKSSKTKQYTDVVLAQRVKRMR